MYMTCVGNRTDNTQFLVTPAQADLPGTDKHFLIQADNTKSFPSLNFNDNSYYG